MRWIRWCNLPNDQKIVQHPHRSKLQQSLAFVAGYGIKCYLIAQDINQLKSRETGYGPDESITSNCHIQAAFPPNRLETAEHLSKLTGLVSFLTVRSAEVTSPAL
jgi:type IV secretory pathway TraG/TraD family ATPase VirD4